MTTTQEPSKLLVSVIMPLYNAENTVEKSVRSVLEQTYRNFELIVVDDQSTDDSYSIVDTLLKSDPRIHLHQLKENGGPGKARNAAIKRANGDYIAFLDADDLWYPRKIEIQLEKIEELDVALICSGYDVLNADYQKIGERQPNKWITHEDMLKTNLIGCLTAMYSVRRLGKVFMPEIRKRQDYALWLNIIRRAGPAYAIQQNLAKYYVQPNSISSNKISMIYWNYQMFRKTQDYTLVKAALLTLSNATVKILERI